MPKLPDLPTTWPLPPLMPGDCARWRLRKESTITLERCFYHRPSGELRSSRPVAWESNVATAHLPGVIAEWTQHALVEQQNGAAYAIVFVNGTRVAQVAGC